MNILDAAKATRAFRLLRKRVGRQSAALELKRIKVDAARPLAAAAKRNAPKDTGVLARNTGILALDSLDAFVGTEVGRRKIKNRRSLKTGRRLNKRRRQRITDRPFYATMVEGGTKKMQGRFFIKRALQQTGQIVLRRLRLKTEQLLAKYVNRQAS